ncbi:hypothetical protein GBA52_006340 [Prunus armeniaca]|nr:hypothetical protein GBA52_006340 [Prunus armeniaca]
MGAFGGSCGGCEVIYKGQVARVCKREGANARFEFDSFKWVGQSSPSDQRWF